MPWPTRFAAAAVCSLLAFHAAPAVADDDPADDHVMWQISTLIHGTTPQVRDAINGPLEQQLARKAEKLDRYNQVKADMDQKLAVVSAGLRKSSPEFANAEKDLVDAKAALVAAHDKQDGSAAIDAQNRKDADEAVISAKLDAAAAADPAISKDKKELDELTMDINHLGPVIANAAKARNTLVNGIRTPVLLPGPKGGNGKGVLGKIKPLKIIDEHSFTADFDLFTVTGVDKNAKGPDGMEALKGTNEHVHLLVTGYDDTSKLKDHVETTINQFYQLSGQKTVNKQTYYVAQRVQPDEKDRAMEHLLSVLDDLHVPAGMNYKP